MVILYPDRYKGVGELDVSCLILLMVAQKRAVSLVGDDVGVVVTYGTKWPRKTIPGGVYYYTMIQPTVLGRPSVSRVDPGSA